jgi:hypothetical protein
MTYKTEQSSRDIVIVVYFQLSPMLDQDLKQDVLELAAIAKNCPGNLQEKCFELLLSNYLDRLKKKEGPKNPAPKDPPPVSDSKTEENEDVEAKNTPLSGSDLSSKDLHLKARRFLEKSGLTLADLNQILYKEGDQILPLYEDLRTTRASESQIRIGLLQALLSGIKTGDFEFNGEMVRKECQTRKCYDGGNFSANYKNNATLFDSFDKYDSKQPTIRLSEEGRQALAKAINELR